ncbi:FAD-dependent oxidoreductase [Nocardia sp. CDC159]|uniref:FAD-dependent oxidoreductase n=1 Tax=Nocardia pulmonis TaxID=2951408 RepID=A0A9X2E1Q0_9NOCA|nr:MULTISPECIES: NAD(P)/FAD-dependent oxidoreductase [Nocardia]MCM6771996.1 FAD-dependent oxidoreductase [Nocardia pulmonis]MCM6785346.1 FAD-dependent oxidoreductase [Nocardia sp. CDC159]
MPRTPMFRLIRRTVAEHAGAGRLGMPVPEFRQARAAEALPTLSRRGLFRLGAALGGAAALNAAAGRRPALARAAEQPRIAVVGGGIAGLTAALTLADAGLAATVYEASDRVGGRMRSEPNYWDGGQVSEYGGEAIDSGHTTIRELCARFGLPLTDTRAAAPPDSDDVLFFEGRYQSRDAFVADFQPVYHALRADLAAAGPDSPTWDRATPAAIALSNMSLAEWLSTRVPGGYASWIARYLDDAYVVEYGLPTAAQTALNLVYLMGPDADPDDPQVWSASDERYEITGGNQRLPEAIAAALPGETIRHGWRLEAITRDGAGTQTLTFDDRGTRRTVVADHTILTLPISILKRIDYRGAGFDPLLTQSISALAMGSCTKLNMQFTSRAWVGRGPWPGVSNGMSFTDVGYQQIWDATAGQPGAHGIAIQYGGGLDTLKYLTATPFVTAPDPAVRLAVDIVLPQFERVVPGITSLWNGKATLSAWHLDPNSLGAYSCYPPGYCHRFAGYEGMRQGNIHLAGEHTSVESQGYMNGGAETGIRAAREILADLGLSTSSTRNGR